MKREIVGKLHYSKQDNTKLIYIDDVVENSKILKLTFRSVLIDIVLQMFRLRDDSWCRQKFKSVSVVLHRANLTTNNHKVEVVTAIEL